MNGNPKLREVLAAIMAAQGDTPTTLSRKCGVPSSTISRFLKGLHGEPRGSTLRRIASAYGMNESQLKGDTPPLVDLTLKREIARDLASMLTSDERKTLRMLRRLSRKSRDAWITIGGRLMQAEDGSATSDKPVPEQGEIFHDNLVRSEPHPENTRNQSNDRDRAKA